MKKHPPKTYIARSAEKRNAKLLKLVSAMHKKQKELSDIILQIIDVKNSFK